MYFILDNEVAQKRFCNYTAWINHVTPIAPVDVTDYTGFPYNLMFSKRMDYIPPYEQSSLLGKNFLVVLMETFSRPTLNETNPVHMLRVYSFNP